jgi:hypothetical protein
MTSDTLTHLSLKYSGRSVAVFRDHCLLYEVSLANYVHRIVRILEYTLLATT